MYICIYIYTYTSISVYAYLHDYTYMYFLCTCLPEKIEIEPTLGYEESQGIPIILELSFKIPHMLDGVYSVLESVIILGQ